MLPNPYILGVEIPWVPIFHWSGVLIGYLIGFWYYKKHVKRSVPKFRIVLLLLALMPIALFGSRITGILEAYFAHGEWLSWWVFFDGPSKGQFRWAGTLMIFIVLVPWLARRTGISNYRTFFDVLAISLAPLTAIVKQGCLFSGDGCYGIPTTLPWGMYFPYGQAPNILPVHPTPVYDGIFHLGFFFFLMWWDRRKKFEGQTALIYFLGASTFYILLEIIRMNPQSPIGLTVPQITYCLVIFISVFQYIKWKPYAINRIAFFNHESTSKSPRKKSNSKSS